jgi:acetyl-CoA carboxylase carboxyltransferase component
MKWLSFMPAYKGGPLAILDPVDPIEREITFCPTRAPYDSRWLFTGRQNPLNPSDFESGFLDYGSFDEIMRNWAQTVIVGRGRLGGIPVGAICVETRTVELNLPADPANLDSEARVRIKITIFEVLV